MADDSAPTEARTEPRGIDARAELESQLDEALRRARAQLSHIKGNLTLVATFLTRAEQ